MSGNIPHSVSRLVFLARAALEAFRKCLRPLSAFCYLLFAMPVLATQYDAVNDLTAGNNPSGPWSYLYAMSVGGALTPLIAETASSSPPVDGFGSMLDYPDNVQVLRNFGPDPYNTSTIIAPPTLLLIDPQGIVADVRWTAPVTGTYDVNGLFEGIDTHGQNHQLLVLRDYDSSLFSLTNGASGFGQDAPFSFSGFFSAGETIDFLANGLRGDFEAVGLTAAITSVPEPSSVALAALAIVGLFIAQLRARR
jgi:hypothetical protein